MHVTLKFLGDIDNRDLPQVCQSLEDACQEVEPFTAWVRDLGSFPTGKPPRVIWAGIDDGDEHPMQIIHAKLDAGLAELGVPREGRLFSPHLTLGRIIRGRASSQLTKLIHQAGLSLVTQFQVDEVQLIASLKDRGGMRYEPISTVEL
jgi:2'-5' RNA ligase